MAKKKSTRNTPKKAVSAASACCDNNKMVHVIFGVILIVLLGYSVQISGDVADIKAELGVTGGEVQQPTQGNNQPTTAPTVEVSVDDDPSKGDADAPVTIIEFSDFECPFCGRFYTGAYQQILSDYVESGKARIVYRDFPLSFHPNAQKAAEAAECADDQGMFWEYHDKLFDGQASLSTANMKLWAAEIGLDSDEFNSCLDSGKNAEEVQNDFNEGRAAGVSGTPSFFINGKKLVGAHPFETFKQVIDAELN